MKVFVVVVSKKNLMKNQYFLTVSHNSHTMRAWHFFVTISEFKWAEKTYFVKDSHLDIDIL